MVSESAGVEREERRERGGGFAPEWASAGLCCGKTAVVDMHGDHSGDIQLPSVPRLEFSDGERGVGDDGR